MSNVSSEVKNSSSDRFQVTFPNRLTKWCDEQADERDYSRSFFIRMCVEHCRDTAFSKNIVDSEMAARLEMKMDQILNEMRKGE